MSAEENRAVMRRHFEQVVNEGKLDLIDEIIATNYVGRDSSAPEEVHGPEGMKEYISMYRSAFPNLNATIEDQIAERDKVVTRYTARGTHQGDLMGIEPTGRRIEVPGIQIDRFDESGKIVEEWNQYDAMGLMQQLGVMEQPSG